jgi:hypothetical protein
MKQDIKLILICYAVAIPITCALFFGTWWVLFNN